MKKFIVMLFMGAFCGGCHIPYPASGVRVLQPYEQYHEVCTTKVDKNGVKRKECRMVRSR